MIIKRLICGVSLFLTVSSCPSFAAGSSSVYQYYLSEGIKAFESHNDDEASRYLAWAHELDPSAKEPQQYSRALSERQRFEAAAGDSEAVYFPYFEEMLQKGKDALQLKDHNAAKQYFYTAHLLNRNAPQPLEYLNLVKRLDEGRVVVEKPVVIAQPLPAARQAVPLPRAKPAARPKSDQVVAAALDKLETPVRPAAQSFRVVPSKKKITEVITLDEILQHAQAGRALVKIELKSSLIVEGKNIQKFLVITEGPVLVKTITRDQLQIDAQKVGATFIHIWDDIGRRTIYVEVSFPPTPQADQIVKVADVEHAKPFALHYANDWSSYYSGDNIPGMTRKNVNFQQAVGIDGETPYGVLDASGSTSGWHQMTEFTTYTTGLSGIPMPGMNDLNVRFFDTQRRLTPLTFPGSSLRGAYLDVNVFKDMVGLAVTHGRELGSFGYFSQGSNSLKSSYVDAGQILLFPKEPNKHYSFNYARGTGSRASYLTKDVYSVEGEQKFGRLVLKGELAKDDKSKAGLAGMRWESGEFRTALNVRDTGKDFTTVTGVGAGQGVTGATWTTNSKIRTASVSTALDVYQEHVFYNPDHPDAVNYNMSSQVSLPLDKDHSLDLGARYSDTPGELSPRTYFSGSARLKRAFGIWGGRRGSIYAGSSYQQSRFAFLPAAEYDRYGAVTGFYLPLTRHLTFNGNYEYSWLTEPSSGEAYNPNVLMAGLSYYKQMTEKLSGNMTLNYRQESGFGGTNSFLSGEDSVGVSAGLSYNPATDVTLFVDGRLNNVWGKTEDNVSYNDMDLRMGLRSGWGSSFSWDPQGTIEGMAFKDKNSNARFDKGEEGVARVKVKVGDKEAVTDDKGWYHMTVRAKRVTVAAVADSVPAGFIFSTPTFTKVMVRQGLRDRVDFGLTTRSGIYGVVFVDKNGSGIPDQGDDFIDGVKVMVDGKTAQISDPQGAYFFTNVPPGTHVLTIDIATLPIKFIPLIKMKNEVNIVEGMTCVFHIPMKFKE
jgi:hypothetical protein